MIYADGSYQGDENLVRELQAKRDGMSIAAHLWAKRLTEDLQKNMTDEAIAAQAELIAGTDQTQSGCHDHSVLCGWWQGKYQVDSNVALSAKRLGHDQLSLFVAGWCRKIEADEALKRMDLLFPLPAELTTAHAPYR